MLTYPQIDPVFFHLGPLTIHWYGVMYLIGFLGGYALVAWRVKHSSRCVTLPQVSDMLFYIALGVIIGGRIGYVLFYQWSAFLSGPSLLFKIWQGGMSFHGGLIGVLVALWLLAKKWNKSVLDLTDLVAPVVPIGLGAGRIGNFINGELWGRVTDMPWGMVFPNTDGMPRHPSQLYEFFLEGVVMFTILWIYSAKPRPRGAVSALFLILYSIFRFTVEFFREPDWQIGFIAFGWMTKGQLLCIPMFIVGMALWVWSNRRGKLRCSNI